MTWEVEVTDQFLEWWRDLSGDQQDSITDRVDLLAETGPDLGCQWPLSSARWRP